jgi:hypothetical protein
MDIDIKNKLISYLQNVEDFAYDQIPDLFHQMITFKLFDGAFCFIASLLLCYAFYLFGKKIYKSKCDLYQLYIVIIYVFFVFFASYGIGKFEVFLKCYFAPKMFLLEYFMGLKG